MAAASSIDVRGLTFDMRPPEVIGIGEWSEIMALDLASTRAVYHRRPRAEIATAIGAQEGVDYYSASRIDPQLAVERGRLLGDQDWANLQVVTVRAKGELVAVLSGGDNVSGATQELRDKKMNRLVYSPFKHLWIREAMVASEYRRRGIALVMGGLMLVGKNPIRPVDAYTIDGSAAAEAGLRSVGMNLDPSRTRPVEQFKPGEQVEQHNFEGRIGVVRLRIAQKKGATRAIRYAKRSIANAA